MPAPHDGSAWTRRSFLRRLIGSAAGLGVLGTSVAPTRVEASRTGGTRSSAVPERIRLSHLVLRPSSERTLTAVTAGATGGADEAGYSADLFGSSLQFSQAIVDSPESVASTARDLTADADVLVVHVDDAEAMQAVVDAARASEVLVLNAGSRDDRLRGTRCDRRLFHVEASDAMYVDACATWLASSGASGASSTVALLSSADRRGQALADRTRSRLSSAGVTLASDARLSRQSLSDALQTTLDAVNTAADAVIWLNVPGPEQTDVLNALGDASATAVSPCLNLAALKDAGVRERGRGPVLWHASLFKYGASDVNDRFAERAGQPIDGAGYANWLAVTVAVKAALNAGSVAPEALTTHLMAKGRFDARKAAPLTFRRWDHQSRHEFYVAAPSDDATRHDVVATVPARMPDDPSERRRTLDALGVDDDATSCAF